MGCGRADLGGLRRSAIFLRNFGAALLLEFSNQEIAHLTCYVSSEGLH